MPRKAYDWFRCSCGEECVMVPSESTGKLAPITTTAYENGNVVLLLAWEDIRESTYRIVPKAEREADPKPRLLKHDDICPDAGRFRK